MNGENSNAKTQKKTNGNKQRLTVQISSMVIEKAKNIVYWTRGLTLAQLVEIALENVIRSHEENTAVFDDQTGEPLKEKGEAFPGRKEELKSGRPSK